MPCIPFLQWSAPLRSHPCRKLRCLPQTEPSPQLRHPEAPSVPIPSAPFGEQCEFISRLLAANNLLETPQRISIETGTTPADFAEIKRRALQPGSYTVLVNHGVDPCRGGWAPVTREFFIDMLNEWQAVEDRIHIGPFAELEGYRRRAQNTVLAEIAAGMFLISLRPEAAFLYGPVYLRNLNPDKQIYVNLLPVLPDKNGVFRAYPGSVIELK